MSQPVTELLLRKIRRDGGTQARCRLDQNDIEEYAVGYRNEDPVPPIDVFNDGIDLWLADGFHRFEALLTIGRKTVYAHMHRGTVRNAILFGLSSNSRHGVRLTNEDKRKAILMMLEDEEWRAWSDREIGRRCGATHVMVMHCRSELCGNYHQSKRKVTRNGTTFTMTIPDRRRDTELALSGFPESEAEALAAVMAEEEAEAERPIRSQRTKCPHCQECKECGGSGWISS